MILVRHGQSEFNAVFSVTRVDPGIPDPKLTEEGRRQAAAAAEALRGAGVRRLIASPYRRALETASIIADGLGLEVTIEPLVRERAAFHCDIGTSPTALRALFPRYRFDHLDDPWWHDHVGMGIAETEEALVGPRRRLPVGDGGAFRLGGGCGHHALGIHPGPDRTAGRQLRDRADRPAPDPATSATLTVGPAGQPLVRCSRARPVITHAPHLAFSLHGALQWLIRPPARLRPDRRT